MRILIDTKSGVPFYRQIIEQVKFAIARGDLQPGDRLATVRQLAVEKRQSGVGLILVSHILEIDGEWCGVVQVECQRGIDCSEAVGLVISVEAGGGIE